MNDRQDRNQVFSNVQSTSQTVQTRDVLFDVPVQTIPLPSQGLLYPVDHPFCNVDLVDVTAMTAREEDILTSAAVLKKKTLVSELIKSCLVNKNVDPASLINGDRNALTIAIRITGYGTEYEGQIECEECGASTNRQFDLGSLEIKKLDIEPVEPNTNAFRFVLPVSKVEILFRFMTGKVEEEINVQQERQKKIFQGGKDTFVTTALYHAIVSVNGNSDRTYISKFVNSMPAGDSQALRKYMRDHEPGIVMKQSSECSACGHVEEVGIPMGPQFFWPNAK